MTVFDLDPFGFGEETPGEKLARENMEADLDLIAALRAVREARGLSQTQLAELLGVSQAAVSTFESDGDSKLSTVRRYAHALGASIRHQVVHEGVDFAASYWPTSGVSFRGVAHEQPAPAQSLDASWVRGSKKSDFALGA